MVKADKRSFPSTSIQQEKKEKTPVFKLHSRGKNKNRAQGFPWRWPHMNNYKGHFQNHRYPWRIWRMRL